MYLEHPVFVQPVDEEIKVWRYMDFTKLMSLINSQRLFFTRADKFADPFEGSYPKINVEARGQLPPEITKGMSADKIENLSNVLKKSADMPKTWIRYTAINCWHMNEHESAAMWNLHLKSNEGVAIQSTYSRLKSSFTDEADIFLGIVRYIDYDTEFLDAGNMLSPFVNKRKSFEHEREVRAVTTRWPDNMDFSVETIDLGIEVEAKLAEMIERIYVAPNSPDWFADLVRSVVEKYEYVFEVVHSRLTDEPLF